MPEEPCSPCTLSIGHALIRRLLLALAALALPSQVVAHGFGVPYRLPAPLPFFLAGVALAVILTFAVVVLLANKPGRVGSNLPRLRLGRLTSSRPLTLLLEIISVALFLIVIVTGIFGSNDPLRNVAPHLVLVAWWLGVAYLSAFLGNVWPLLDPWRILFDWVLSFAKRVDDEAELSLNLRYPHWLGVWPAALLFMTFSWFYVASPDPSRPSTIAAAVLIYSVITWLGMVVFGEERWLRQGEAFTVAFGLLARFSPTEVRPKPAPDEDLDNREHGKGTAEQELVLRPLAAGLAGTPAVSISVAVFVVVFLATVLFGAFTATSAWVSFVVSYYETFGHLTG